MRRLSYIAKGTFAGTVATVPMSALMWAAQRAGYLGELPPERITKAALGAVGIDPERETTEMLSLVNHLGFGAAVGTVYAALREPGPRTGPDLIAGAAFGLTVWLVSYEGWLPAVGIMPNVQWDRPGRPESMAAAHIVFGTVLAGLLRRLRSP